jgi:hypothetical protein
MAYAGVIQKPTGGQMHQLYQVASRSSRARGNEDGDEEFDLDE